MTDQSPQAVRERMVTLLINNNFCRADASDVVENARIIADFVQGTPPAEAVAAARALAAKVSGT